jgi:hypothetical protein
MTLLRRAIQRELVDFLEKLQDREVNIAQVSKAAFCKARKKLRPEAFIKLNEILTDTFYDSSNHEVLLWKDYRLLASDGSTAEVPNSPEIQNEWGVFQERSDGKKICMARLEHTYDVLNHLSIVSSIDRFSVSESVLFWQHLEQLKPTIEKNLHVLDRYYASHLLMFHLDNRGDEFCFRMKKNWWKVVEHFYDSDDQDCTITLNLPKKDYEAAEKLGIKEKQIQVRLVKILLDSGEIEILLTSLIDPSISLADLKELYGLRWGVETSFCALKHKAEVENFSGKSIKVVKQDYFAKLFILNYTALLIRPIDRLLQKQPKVKHTHKVNFNEALARMKYAVVDLFLFQKIPETLQKLFKAFYTFTEPIRKNRKFKRHKLPKRKYHRTYCPV